QDRRAALRVDAEAARGAARRHGRERRASGRARVSRTAGSSAGNAERIRAAFQPRLEALVCGDCGASWDLSEPRATCPACGRPLLARYGLKAIGAEVRRDELGRYGSDLWRYRAVLPFAEGFPLVRLGEGGTPLRPLPHLAEELEIERLWLKEEAGNPTHSF